MTCQERARKTPTLSKYTWSVAFRDIVMFLTGALTNFRNLPPPPLKCPGVLILYGRRQSGQTPTSIPLTPRSPWSPGTPGGQSSSKCLQGKANIMSQASLTIRCIDCSRSDTVLSWSLWPPPQPLHHPVSLYPISRHTPHHPDTKIKQEEVEDLSQG